MPQGMVTMSMREMLGTSCPVCGHALRLVLTQGGLHWVCPVCGEVKTCG